MPQDFAHAATIKGLQVGPKSVTDLLRTHPFLARQWIVVLLNVIALQMLESSHRMFQASRAHAPSTNRCADEIDRLLALCQPFTKDEPVQWPQDQSFGAAGRSRDHPHMFRPQAVLADVGQGIGSGMDVKGLHGLYFLMPCSLAKALAMADPAAGGEV